jgi:anti-sigma regulatory factor (Ser/Thr protein kinase)
VTTIERPCAAGANATDGTSLALRRELGELERLGSWVQALEQESGLSADLTFALGLCLEEAVANIIMYGGAKGGDIHVTIARTSAGVVVRIEDDGWHFDPTAAPAPAPPRSLDDASAGNLGIHLIRSFSSDMRYQRDRGLNTLTLTFAPAEH